MVEEEKSGPGTEDLDRSRDYFGRLNRTYNGLDDFPLVEMPEHLANLKFSAGRLDNLPGSLWRSVFNSDKELMQERFPYIPMQIVLWGLYNGEVVISARDSKPEMKFKGNFSKEAWIYKLFLKDLSKEEPNIRGDYRDHAEQCFRMIDAYIELGKYFGGKGLPEGVSEF